MLKSNDLYDKEAVEKQLETVKDIGTFSFPNSGLYAIIPPCLSLLAFWLFKIIVGCSVGASASWFLGVQLSVCILLIIVVIAVPLALHSLTLQNSFNAQLDTLEKQIKEEVLL